MPNINKDVDFIDNDDQGRVEHSEKDIHDHKVKDVLHKIFVIQSAYNHSKAIEESNKPKSVSRKKGALDG